MYVTTPQPSESLEIALKIASELADLAEVRNDQYALTRALRILAALRDVRPALR